MNPTSTRFGQYQHLRTLSPQTNKLTGTVTVGISRPTRQWEGAQADEKLELRTFWDDRRQTLVTQALQLAGGQKVVGERYIDEQGELKQTFATELARPMQIRLLRDMQLQEQEHYVRTNRFAFMEPMRQWWSRMREGADAPKGTVNGYPNSQPHAV